MRTARIAAVPLSVALLLAPLCACTLKKEVKESAEDVLTLKRGTISGLRDLRGTGPFREYALPPDEMLDVVARACRHATDTAGRPVSGIEVSPHYREVVAKERRPGKREDASYSEDWVTAVVVTVHPIEGQPDRCRVEIHATTRGPMIGGATAWGKQLPGWIDEEIAKRPDVPPVSR